MTGGIWGTPLLAAGYFTTNRNFDGSKDHFPCLVYMKTSKSFFLTGGITLILISIVLIAGCASTSAPTQNQVTVISTPASAIVVQTPDMTAVQTPVATPSTPVPTKSVSLGNGMTLSYPATWEMETPGDTAMRDYGRVTTNLANFFSPSDAKNQYTSISVDLEPELISDNDMYFNLATVGVQKTYGSIDISHHSQLSSAVDMVSACTKCKHYNLEFETKDSDKWYHFVDADGTFYIFSINNPDLNHEQSMELLKSVRVTPSAERKTR